MGSDFRPSPERSRLRYCDVWNETSQGIASCNARYPTEPTLGVGQRIRLELTIELLIDEACRLNSPGTPQDRREVLNYCQTLLASLWQGWSARRGLQRAL